MKLHPATPCPLPQGYTMGNGHPPITDTAIWLRSKGMAVHIVKPMEKRPDMGQGWAQQTPLDIDQLLYRLEQEGSNTGVRTGICSEPFPGWVLMVLDMDVLDDHITVEELATMETYLQNMLGDVGRFPAVISGSGGRSRHFWILVPKALVEGGWRPAKRTSDRSVTMRDGTNKHVWELDFFLDGKQLVLPGSTHPNGMLYHWERPPWDAEGELNIPWLDEAAIALLPTNNPSPGATGVNAAISTDMPPIATELVDFSNASAACQAFLTGEQDTMPGCDGSGSILSACTVLQLRSYTMEQAFNILLQSPTVMEIAMRPTHVDGNAARAPWWIWNYGMGMHKPERAWKLATDPTGVFDNIPHTNQATGQATGQEATSPNFEDMKTRAHQADLQDPEALRQLVFDVCTHFYRPEYRSIIRDILKGRRYQVTVWDELVSEFIAAGRQAVGEMGEDGETQHLISRFVFVSSTGRFYDLEKNTTLTPQSFNQKEQGHPQADLPTNLFMENNGVCVDEEVWLPHSIMPGSVIPNRVGLDPLTGRLGVNTYRPPGEVVPNPDPAAVTPWLSLLTHLVPDDEERKWFVLHMAATLQQPQNKINWQILMHGARRIGKDMVLQPLAQYLGPLANQVSAADIDAGWGDFNANRKVIIFEEIYQAGNRKFENQLKPWAASNATGMTSLNMKGGKIVNQRNLLSIYAMSNEHDCMHLSPDDARWFIINAQKVAKLAPEVYSSLGTWYTSQGGIQAVVAYLLSLDVSDFPYGRLPYHTSAYFELVAESRGLVAMRLEEMISNRVGLMGIDLVSTNELARVISSDLGRNIDLRILRREMRELGAEDLGDCRVKNGGSARLMAVRFAESYRDLPKSELYRLWQEKRAQIASI